MASGTPTTNYSLAIWAKGDANWHLDANANATEIDLELKKHQDEANAAKTNADLVAGGHEATGTYGSGLLAEAAGNISAEVVAARGATANLAARLAGVITAAGALIGTTTAPGEWTNGTLTNPAYHSSSQVKVDGDKTAIFTPGTLFKVTWASSGDKFYHVKTSVFSASITYITIWDSDPSIPNEACTIYYPSHSQPESPDKSGALLLSGSLARTPDYFFRGSMTVFYYDESTYTNPFTEDAARAQTNTGMIARVEYETGGILGFTYDALGGNLVGIEKKILIANAKTLIASDTLGFDGGTGYLTSYVRG